MINFGYLVVRLIGYVLLVVVCDSVEVSVPDIRGYMDYFGITEKKCSLVPNFHRSVNETLRQNIIAQDEAVDAVVNVLSYLHTRREMHRFSPLIMAVTGSTGIGKSETAKLIGKGLYGTSSFDDHPCGLLILSGKAYSGISKLRAQRIVKNQIIDHLIKTDGNAFIVFDEIQSLDPGILEVLSPALDDTFPHLSRQEIEVISGTLYKTKSYHPFDSENEAETCENDVCYLKDSKIPPHLLAMGQVREVTRKYSTSRSIFLFISDIGADVMTNILVKFGDRVAIPKYELRKEIKRSLDSQWERLHFTKAINEVIPYLPLEPQHIQEILLKKVRAFSKEYQLKKWLDILIEEDVILYLSSSDFISYYSNEGKIFSTGGVRSLITNGPLQDLEALLSTFHFPDRILHIGMVTSDIYEKVEKKWQNIEEDKIFMQWCTPDPTMLVCTRRAPDHCPEINFKQFMNRQHQISPYIWHKTIEEDYGYEFHISLEQHVLNPMICEPGWIWRIE